MSSIIAKSLYKSYNSVNAVDGIDLSVKSGQVFGFLGPNGAGKSTTIKLLTTLIPPTSGELTILGINAKENPLQVRHRIGVVLQQPSYEPSLSVEKSLEKYGLMWDVPGKIRKKRVEELLSDFDLNEIRKKKTEDLSIGQRRRLQVAREFMHDMDLLFLDEPTIALDSPDDLKKRFGSKKTIKIHLAQVNEKLKNLFNDVKDCKIDFNSGTNITIISDESEVVLMKVLQILNSNNITIEDLSAIPTNLEEIFLKVVNESNESDT